MGLHMKIIIETKRRFGRIDHKAINDTAKIFATRDGVIPEARLALLVQAGFEVEEVK